MKLDNYTKLDNSSNSILTTLNKCDFKTQNLYIDKETGLCGLRTHSLGHRFVLAVGRLFGISFRSEDEDLLKIYWLAADSLLLSGQGPNDPLPKQIQKNPELNKEILTQNLTLLAKKMSKRHENAPSTIEKGIQNLNIVFESYRPKA